ncbi:FANCD2 opposite strand protein [Alligator mississippiensis]|uniref:FANCD2 opposite strand protein n=1 Tax=Alligator mississippiensis TaxID=8496 RepID=UPI0028781165|nr:FANCD2 opposite strand protein [Alligator mississippiensis]
MRPAAMAGPYQLWGPWSPLDEALQWLRGATPRAGPARALRAGLEAALCAPGPGPGPGPGARQHGAKEAAAPLKPEAVRLSGLDSVFGRVVTAQPPRWTGSFRVSQRSAFCQVISPGQRWPRGLREPQVRLAVAMCRQMLRAILLLYAAYKKCAFALQHSR